MKRAYLAGPMSGIPFFNFPAFRAAATTLRNRGYEVFSPIENDIRIAGYDFSPDYPTGKHDDRLDKLGITYRRCLSDDCAFICELADVIAMMPGWEKSGGATIEHGLSALLSLEFIYLTSEDCT